MSNSSSSSSSSSSSGSTFNAEQGDSFQLMQEHQAQSRHAKRLQKHNSLARDQSLEVETALGKRLQPGHTPKSPETLALLIKALQANPLFSHLCEDEIESIALLMVATDFSAHERIVAQGDVPNAVFVVAMGEVEMVRNGVHVGSLSSPQFFGGLEWMRSGPCSAAIHATVDTMCWRLDGDVYQWQVSARSAQKRRLLTELLSEVDFLESMSRVQLLALVDAMDTGNYKAGDCLLRFGDHPECIHFILEGELEVWGRDQDGHISNVYSCGPGDCVGALELIHNHPCLADVLATIDVKTSKLTREYFENHMGSLVGILKHNALPTPSGFDWQNCAGMNDFIDRVTSLEQSNNRSHSPRQTSISDAASSELGSPLSVSSISTPMEGARTCFRRVAVSSTVAAEEHYDLDFDDVVSFEKPSEDHEMLKVILSRRALFTHLQDYDMDVIVRSMFLKTFEYGEVMLGIEEHGNHLYVILNGNVKCSHGGKDEVLSRGSCFGEEQLMYSSPHAFSVVAADTVQAYMLSRSTYQNIVTAVSRRQRDLYEELLLSVGFLSSMTKEELLTLAECLRPARFNAGDYIIKFGSEGEWMYIILEGEVEVWGRDADGSTINVCRFGTGDCIGELEFINSHKCVADVVAVVDVNTVKLNRNHFELCMGAVVDVLKRNYQTQTYTYYSEFNWTDCDFIKGLRAGEEVEEQSSSDRSSDSSSQVVPFNTELFKRRSAVTSRRLEALEAEDFEPTFIEKSVEEQELILKALQRKPIFAMLEVESLNILANVMAKVQYPKGEYLTWEAMEDENFYVIAKGECDVIQKDKGPEKLESGDSFGELGLMHQAKSPKTVKVSSDVVVAFVIDRTTYRSVVMQASIQRQKLYEDLLSKVSFLKSMTSAELCKLADALQPSQYQAGEYLIHCGAEGDYMHIILSGEVDVIGRDEFLRPVHVCTFAYGHPVGELEFINHHVCVADVVTKTEVETAKLSRRHFEVLMGSVVDVLKRNTEQPVYNYYNQALVAVKSGSFNKTPSQNST